MGSQISLPTEAFLPGHLNKEFSSKTSTSWVSGCYDTIAKRMLEAGVCQKLMAALRMKSHLD